MARVRHGCDACGTFAINPGDEYQRAAIADGGTVYTWRTCEACCAITQAVFAWLADRDEGAGIEDYRGWASEAVINGGHLAPLAQAYIDRSAAR